MSNSVTPREAQRLVRSVVVNHNANCVNRIRTRASATGLSVGLEGKGQEFVNCSSLADVAAFADGVADVEIFGDRKPARDFETHSEEAAYFFGALRAEAVCSAERTGGDNYL